MKKILSILLVILMLAMPVLATAEVPDIKDHINEEAILALKDYGIVDCYEDGSYKPDNYISRAEVTKLIVAAITEELPETYSGIFTDVFANDWFALYVEEANMLGLVHGFGNGEFKPNDNITFEQLCAIILNALGYDTIGDKYPTEVVSTAFELNLINKINARGGDYVTRGEVAQIIYNALGKNFVEVYDDVAYPKTAKFGDNIGRKYSIITIDNDVATFGDVIKDYDRDSIEDELLSTRVEAVYCEIDRTLTPAEQFYGVLATKDKGFIYGKGKFISIADLLKDNVKFYRNGKELATIDYSAKDTVELIFVDDKIVAVVDWRVTDTIISTTSMLFNKDAILTYGDDYIAGTSVLSYYGDFAVFIGNKDVYARYSFAGPTSLNYFKDENENYFARIYTVELATGSPIAPFATTIIPCQEGDVDKLVEYNGGYIWLKYDYFDNLVKWELAPYLVK